MIKAKYSELCNDFYEAARRNKDLVDGKKMEEIKEICPEVYSKFQDVKDYIGFVERFFGIKL